MLCSMDSPIENANKLSHGWFDYFWSWAVFALGKGRFAITMYDTMLCLSGIWPSMDT